ncbi:Coenzyme F390 synthetase-like protein [Exiguobacterium sibiricum 255-15]|uniref:Coenzyme F390 synthetase-like protein n=1 Tax=Exiguobacterium sibiricum (strain DSM 17290 / CCUG 55495 / CIP 109462 / JCM 13490 / 255-15) TaxID=262543 RepID=B1YH60_EXIS2|nr:phenylacetate--CoA ligase family protein [Exiguobacterium sibiricum]ACB61121.1 Coenzyme F390 synthetase-like protein [Exiguobacterium sibiricum 255-15]
MGIKEQVYLYSPVFMQNLLTTLYGYRLQRERYGPAYQTRFQELADKLEKPIDVERDQLARLNTFLLFCRQHSPYYHTLFKDLNLQLPFRALTELLQIPSLEKEMLRQQIESIRTDLPAPILGKTGGTTGKSIQVRYTKEDMQVRMAHLDFFKATHGVKKGMRRISFTAQALVSERQQKPVYWRMNHALNQLLFTVKKLSAETMTAYLQAIDRFDPESIDGLPSAMIELAYHAKRIGMELQCRPRAIFPTAEMMTATERKLIEDVFHAPVFDQYASSEGAPIVSECRFGNKHLHYEMGIIEIEPDGQILVTSFDTHGTPLVRYRVGDRMTSSGKTCSCGHPGPVIDSIDGRGRGYIVKQNGQKVFEGQLSSLVKVLPNSVERVQYIQNSERDITFLYIPDRTRFLSEHEEQLYRFLKTLLGSEMNVSLRAVDNIPREVSGKTLLVKQLM